MMFNNLRFCGMRIRVTKYKSALHLLRGCYCTIIFFLFFLTNTFSQKSPKVEIDTVNVQAIYDSGTIVFDRMITHKRQWLDILSNDTTIFAYFQRERRQNDFKILVSRIDTHSVGAMIYRFRVVYILKFNEPVIDYAKALIGAIGATYFYVRVERLLFSNRLSIAEIRFDGVEI